MTEAPRALCAVAVLAALSLWIPQAARAEDPCRAELVASAVLGDEDSGIGGTGLTGDDGSGIGGTGLEGGSGIGGTGLEGGSGIGGTGLHVYGTITALGSICVNGLRIGYDAEVPVHVDGRPADTSALVVGVVVWVETRHADAEIRAQRIDVLHALVGRIESVTPDQAQLSVLGRRVDVPPETRLEGEPAQLLRVGEVVSVSGLWRDDDRVVATRIARPQDQSSRVGPRLTELIDRASRGARFSIEGYVTERVGTAVRLGELRFDGIAADRVREVVPGARVRATGRVTVDRALRIAPPERPVVTRPPSFDRPERPELPTLDRPEKIERPEVFDRPQATPRDSLR